MRVEMNDRDGILIARPLTACLDVGNARLLKEQVEPMLEGGRRDLVVDLSRVCEIDSSGLGALVALLKYVRRWDGSARLVGVAPEIRSVIELTMVHRILPVHDSLEEALEAIRPGD